ncbi:MAG: CbtB-domain containing protein [Kiloniellaceae bacterium]
MAAFPRRADVFPAEPDLDGDRQLEDFMQTATTSQTHTSISQSRRMIAAATLLFGLGLVFVTGFAHSATIHNAAHDTRHAMAFPCH